MRRWREDDEDDGEEEKPLGRFIRFTTAANAIDAALLAAALEDDGVPVQRVGGTASLGFGDLPSDALHVELWIPEGRLEEGRRVMAEFEARRRAR